MAESKDKMNTYASLNPEKRDKFEHSAYMLLYPPVLLYHGVELQKIAEQENGKVTVLRVPGTEQTCFVETDYLIFKDE